MAQQKELTTRVNFQIRATIVRLSKNGEQLGIMPIDQARKLATEAGLDLVELVANANPPVCGIMDYGKYRYNQKIKEKEQLKRQREASTKLKEIKFRPFTDEHDFNTKVNQAKNFLMDGKQVQLSMRFSGQREMAHKNLGLDLMNRAVEQLKESGTVQKPPRLSGNFLNCIIDSNI